MRIIGAYSLLALGGKAQPTAAEVEQLLVNNGISVDRDEIATFIAAIDGRPLAEVLKMGLGKMADMTARASTSEPVAAQLEAAPAPITEVVEEDIVSEGPDITCLFDDPDY